MSQVEFDSDQFGGLGTTGQRPATRGPVSQSAGGSALSRLIIKIGFASDDKGAQKVLLGIAVVALCVTAYFSYKLLFANRPQIPPVMPAFVPH